MKHYTVVARKNFTHPELEQVYQIQKYLKNCICDDIFVTSTYQDAIKKSFIGARQSDFIVAIGGDGTFHEVVKGIFQSQKEVPILYIPGGTVNDMANNLNANYSLQDYLKDALQKEPDFMDTFSISNDFFTYVAAGGYLSNVPYEVRQQDKQKWKKDAYLLNMLKKGLQERRPYEIKLTIDKKTISGEYLTVIFANTKTVGGFDTFSMPKLNDHQLEVILIKAKNTLSLLKESKNLIQNKKMWSELNCVETYRGKNLFLSANRTFDHPFCLDGECSHIQEKTIQIKPYKRILVYTGKDEPFQID